LKYQSLTSIVANQVFSRSRLIIGFVILSFQAWSQEFGGNPPDMKWRQINTDTVRVIYPESLNDAAQRVANTVHYLNRNFRGSIGDRQNKINIVLQNQTVISNGYVGLTPFRSELYLNEPQNSFDLGSNWLDLLSIHEYRHALQFMNIRRGVTKAAYYLAGNLGWSYFSSLSIPDWFMEGDAVVSETALTAQGRGRIPAFYNGYKSLIYDGKLYSYQKAENGSLKDFVPDHYKLGFLLSNYGRDAYGKELWKNVISDAGMYKGIFYPFSRALKRQTNLSTKEFYQKSMDFYASEWQDDQSLSDNSEDVTLSEKKETFTTYEFPYRLENGDLLVYKSSYNKIGGFYRIDGSGKERLIRNQGRVLDNYYSYKNNIIVWAEIGQDERWSWQTYSNIILYDIRKKERKKITTSQRYFSPDLSHDSQKLVVFQTTDDLQYSLNIISAEDGHVVSRLNNPENYYYSYPKWAKDDNHIFTLARNDLGESALVRIDVRAGSHEMMVPFTNHQLGIPFETDKYLFFAASFTGVDNIYAIDLESRKIFQVTNGNLGSYQAFVDERDNKLLFSRFTSMGNDIKSMPLDPKTWKEFNIIEPVDLPAFDFVATEDEGRDITKEIPQQAYETSKYPKASKLINIHSWSLYFEDPNYEWAVQSNNILNTLNMNLGVRYNRNDEAFTYFFDAEYAQFYPVLFLSASTGRRNARTLLVNDQDVVVDTVRISWWENIVRPGVTLPFDLSSGLYSRQLNLSGYYSYTNVNFVDKTIETIRDIEDFSYDSYTVGLSFLNRRKLARKNIYSGYSQYLTFSYDRLIDREKVDQIFVDSEWTFPGLSPNHSLVFQASMQQEDQSSFPRFGDNFFYSRGYNEPAYDIIYRVGSNYHFPIAYPDWGFWGIIYLYRLRANLFFDYSRAHLSQGDLESVQLYNSIGAELMLDTRVLNLYDFTFGLRYSYLINEDPVQPNLQQSIEFFIPVWRF
jgi:hypothetical protein